MASRGTHQPEGEHRLIGQTLSLQSLSKSFGKVRAVENVSFDIEAGEFVSVLGPSGSGKTTLLTMIAGFERPSGGLISIGGRDVTAVAPNRRNIGMVFQKYALFPHMTVLQNVAFPLRMRGMARPAVQARVSQTLDLVQLARYGDRYPSQLSGGQQQRVAVARALVFEPPVLLMDEPLGALDRNLRQSMQLEIKRLQEKLGATVLYVTHDQDEALTMSDRVAIMADGALVQIGAPAEIYGQPRSPFVADFIGKMNFMDGEYQGEDAGVCKVRLSPVTAVTAPLPCDEELKRIRQHRSVKLAIRPERLSFVEPGAQSALPGRVEATIFVGAFHLYLVRLETRGNPLVQVQLAASSPSPLVEAGKPVALAADTDAFHVFASAEGVA
jgi:mannopine transport system ATP-binding protein